MDWTTLPRIRGENVRGLRSGFGASKVQVVGLGGSATIRGSAPDFNLVLGYSDILPEDVELLTRELNLKETTAHRAGRAGAVFRQR